MTKNSNVNVDVNKGMAGVSALAAAISFGFAAATFEFMHPFAAGAVAGFVGYGLGWTEGKLGLGAILISAAVFMAAYSQY